MADKLKQLKQNLKQLIAANPNLPIDAVVTKVSGDVCSVKIGDFEISDVRLKTTVDGKDNFLVVPKLGSRVLMLSTDGTLGNLTIIKADAAEKIIFNDNGLTVEIDGTAKKVLVKNETTSLKDLFSQISDILKTIKVYTPAGPSGTPLPDTVLKIEKFETDFKTILK